MGLTTPIIVVCGGPSVSKESAGRLKCGRAGWASRRPLQKACIFKTEFTFENIVKPRYKNFAFREDQYAALENIPFSTSELCLQNLPLKKIVSKAVSQCICSCTPTVFCECVLRLQGLLRLCGGLWAMRVGCGHPMSPVWDIVVGGIFEKQTHGWKMWKKDLTNSNPKLQKYTELLLSWGTDLKLIQNEDQKEKWS